jgi:hypothetical protein
MLYGCVAWLLLLRSSQKGSRVPTAPRSHCVPLLPAFLIDSMACQEWAVDTDSAHHRRHAAMRGEGFTTLEWEGPNSLQLRFCTLYGLRNPSMAWTADLDREKGSLAHMFRNAKRDSTTVVAQQVFEHPLHQPVPLRCDDPAAGYLPVPVPVPIPLLQFWTCRSSSTGGCDLPLLRFPGWLCLQ